MSAGDETVEALQAEVEELRGRIAQLEAVETAQEETEAGYLTLVESSDDAIFTKDVEGRYVIVNSELARRLGKPKEAIVGRTPLEVYPAGVGEQIREDDLKVLRSGVPEENEDLVDTSEGHRVLLARKFPIRDFDGRVVGLLGVSRDITDRKRAEDTLAEQARELARSNAELEQFAYVASHDLQEPLRMVTSYVQLLERRYKGRLDEDADEFIAYAVDGASRMQVLINDLLTYSRVGTQDVSPEPTDCEEVVRAVTANLRPLIDETGAEVKTEGLPTVECDGTQVAQLLQNLIGNALKFRGDETPRVHVGAAPRGDEWLFTVRDNGIGIDPRYSSRIFEIFQRLHGRGRYPGTGIGLAICKKIVERHGGRIWVESESGGGSAFCFTLPALQGAGVAPP